MKKNIIIIICISILVILITLIFVLLNDKKELKNELSREDTFNTFISLTEKGDFKEAKTYTTNNFNASLSRIKDIEFSNRKRNYELSNYNTFVYTDVYEIGYYKMITTYYFELKQTSNGWKIDNFYDEISNNESELNLIINQL